MGGEKHRREVLRKRYKGSPPRGRGKDPSRCPPLRPVWITPAWAGKSRKCTPSQPAGQDHPRVGGEKHTEQRATAHVWGSPPRGRGKATDSIDLYVTSRITPAWAGKRSTALWPGVTAWDHPRVGGEKLDFATTPVRTLGSPPRGRGKAPPVKMKPSTPRITPAWAGKRGQYRRPGRAHRDHPRVGGEKYNSSVERNHKRGSPPRGRGKASFSGNSRLGVGITPAWAGKSLSRYLAAAAGRDHPRVGGEKGNR